MNQQLRIHNHLYKTYLLLSDFYFRNGQLESGAKFQAYFIGLRNQVSRLLDLAAIDEAFYE